MTFVWTALMGAFLGFAFGVGCSLAVMYAIYLSGYRAAVRDSVLSPPSPRWLLARRKLIPPQSPAVSPSSSTETPPVRP